MNIPPILILAIIWFLISLVSKSNKAKQQAARNARPGAAKTGAKASQQAKPQETSGVRPEAEPARPTMLQPSITFTEHDDSVYQGSMSAVTGEGYDPCHEEQLAPLTRAETAVPATEAPEAELQLSWTGSDIVRGFVMGEILNRR